ncbi:hypothetical protein DEGR_33340 (plasmid) [Deinococcus grandis]|nr:hypothetical protein DEGR_33340 [Deinococcus grandis]
MPVLVTQVRQGAGAQDARDVHEVRQGPQGGLGVRDGLIGGARVGHVQRVRHDAGLRGEVGRDGLAVRGEHPRAPRGERRGDRRPDALRGAEGRDIQTFGGGEQQRVHLARTLAQLHGTPGDRVLLLDGPTASLDLAHQHATLRLARDLCAEGVGVLAVLHDLNLAAQYADRVLLLDGGQVLTCAPPGAALTSEHIRAAYGHDVLVTRHPCLDCPLIVSAG